MRKTIVAAAALAGSVSAHQTAWAQCGGVTWKGETECVSGYVCVPVNEYYNQCQPDKSVKNAAHPTPVETSHPPAATGPSKAGKFKFFGINQSGAEFGNNIFPGTWGKEFTFPDTKSLQTLLSRGYNTFRIPFAMERMSPDKLTGPLNTPYLANLTFVVNFITKAGGYAILDPHNYGRFYGNVISDVDGFQTFWKTLAGHFKTNARVIFDTNNEYHDIDQTLVLNLNQAAIDGIRAAGATSQYIFVEGNSWSGAWTWTTVNTNLAALKDPQNLLVYEMHQYLDSDSSGTNSTCVSDTIGAERVASATTWLRTNGKKGVLGEFAGGPNERCMNAAVGMVDALAKNSDVWMGALWWAGGPWWADYYASFEPPNGKGYQYYNDALVKYVPPKRR